MTTPSSRRRPSSSPAKKTESRIWSGAVTRNSNALDLEPAVFAGKNPSDIAKSLKRSAERSIRRKGTAYQSAMSMLNFYINRAGRKLPKSQLAILDRAKGALRRAFGRT